MKKVNAESLKYTIELQNQHSTTAKSADIPSAQTVIQNGVISLEYNHTIKPSLRKEITAMIVHNIPSLFHNILKFITHLPKPRKIHT